VNVLVVGFGSIAARHVNNLRALVPDAHVTALRRSHAGESPAGVDAVVTDWADGLAHPPDLALICSPASAHVEQAVRAAEAGADLLIEKPIADRLDDLSMLRETIERCRRIALVGYQFRFYPPLMAAKQAIAQGRIGRILSIRAEAGTYLPDWRPGRDYRQTVSAQRRLGGGVLLELSHELDLVRWLAGDVEEVCAVTGQLTDLDLDVEDLAEILLRFDGGAIGSVHIDMADRMPHRTLRVVGDAGTLTWSWQSHEVRLGSPGREGWTSLWNETLDRNAMYVAETTHLLDCIASRQPASVGLDDGEAVLRIALAARRSSEQRRWVKP